MNIAKTIGTLIVVALVGLGILKLRDNGDSGTLVTSPSSSPSASPSTLPSPSTSATPATQRKYRDGTYTAQGTYRSPAQQETIRIEITLKDDIITKATFFENPSNPTTARMQGQFEAGFTQFVVGKSIDAVNLTVVNGSSLTPKGFMDALAKIKAEARV